MEPSTASHQPAGHESRDIAPRPIAVASIGGAVVVLAMVGLMWLLIDFSALRQARESPPANPLASTFARREPPEPRLQPHPLRDLQSLREWERSILGGYGWVDRESGVVRIPIERAKKLLAEREAAR
jgi:hypothetical protein